MLEHVSDVSGSYEMQGVFIQRISGSAMSWLGGSVMPIVDIRVLVHLNRHSSVEWQEEPGSFQASCPVVDGRSRHCILSVILTSFAKIASQGLVNSVAANFIQVSVYACR